MMMLCQRHSVFLAYGLYYFTFLFEYSASLSFPRNPAASRQDFINTFVVGLGAQCLLPFASDAKCSDIETCREIGEAKDAEMVRKNPIVRLQNGLQYKVLTGGLGDAMVGESSQIKIIYSVSQANGSYMYSQGFGYNKIDIGGGEMASDLGIDTLSVRMGSSTIPIGIQNALMGAKRGERRRIQCPPSAGFETSNWQPAPTTFRGQRQIIDYRNTLNGRGANQPPFPAPTIWDVEVITIR